MRKALFFNGVFDSVLEEILISQETNPGKVFYLQPYSQYAIKELRQNPPNENSPLPAYFSTTAQLNHICYHAEVVGWEDKRKITEERLALLNEHIKNHQSNERDIYPEANGKKCVNLIAIRNLKRVPIQVSTSHLIKAANNEPLKPRTQAGNWANVYELSPFLLEKPIDEERLEEELEKAVAKSLKDDSAARTERLLIAPKFPERVQTIACGFKRNADVIAAALERAIGRCELCGQDAPFIKASDGTPYLEVHHWITLSEGGEDSLQNACAVCPNCHKQAHFGREREYIKLHKAFPPK